MNTFIRVVELWVPDRTRMRLEFGGGLYGEALSAFKAVSEDLHFGYDEGLPGKAWASGHPVILTKFANSYFKRTDQAMAAGLTCGVAVPVFAGEFLQAVMVLFCGDDAAHVGAIELWHNDPEISHEMGALSTAITAPRTCSSSTRVTPDFPVASACPDAPGRPACR
ncbi:GAF domain-containing protein [Bradyrhizobium liaoningense]|uniref:GAF domain-containing protein n=1 Tax=Bradyrhizobium liaoningense TaxID=43992 RepID=UPI001FECC993|nr:GAF domain-containing protein [Bradyrhizobium liaoningense]